MCRGLLAAYSKEDHPHVPENLLSLLTKLVTFPTEPSEINKWWVEELAVRPSKPKRGAVEDEEESEESPDVVPDDADTTDDWRKFFDEDNATKDSTHEQKGFSARLHKLTVHQSLHSLSSHRTIFTRTWLALLPLLSGGPEETSKTLVTRALNVMHRGVMPHLTRAVLIMDWVASCVDYGASDGLCCSTLTSESLK